MASSSRDGYSDSSTKALGNSPVRTTAHGALCDVLNQQDIFVGDVLSLVARIRQRLLGSRPEGKGTGDNSVAVSNGILSDCTEAVRAQSAKLISARDILNEIASEIDA